MKPSAILILGLLLFILNQTISYQMRSHTPSHDWQLTTVSSDCCTSKGGTLCGSIWIDCCKRGCQKGYLDSQWCINDEIFNPSDCNTCTNVCKNKGGMICATNILIGTGIECCTMGNCVGSIDRSCKPNESIDLGNCMRDSIFQLAQYQLL